MPCFTLYRGETGCSAYVLSFDHNKDEEKQEADKRHGEEQLSREAECQMLMASIHKEPLCRHLDPEDITMLLSFPFLVLIYLTS